MSQSSFIEYVDDMDFDVSPSGQSIYVSSRALIAEDCRGFEPDHLIVSGFNKSKILDFGWSQYGYEFYTNHPKWGEVTIAIGQVCGLSLPDTISHFDKIYCGIDNEFKAKDYRSNSAMGSDIDDFMEYCEKQLELFVDNLNEAIESQNIDVKAIAKSFRRNS